MISAFEFASRACDVVFGDAFPLPRVPRPSIGNRENPMERYNDGQFLSWHGTTSQREPGESWGLPLTPMLQLLVTLRFYDAGSFQVVTGDLVNVSQPTVCRAVGVVTQLIARHLFRELIPFPSAAQFGTLMSDFYALAHFPGVSWCIDCAHVPIKSPSGDDADVFRNRKGVFSINAVTNPQLQFYDVVASWPWSVHDSRIFDNSRMRVLYEESRVPGTLLGDMGYACFPFLMTPLADPGPANTARGRQVNPTSA
ncbi:hypothetical protein HPB47_002923 [Ixodes persulcatus]|uniref:Uncharacterized protein n=1 Tax=Ixodes persulcatus TaxID=34615 RepID=A0AC60PJZ3_IXOPE|nr:hypothetical protein HPB47_002923 [Ixodes persulcatus]